MATDFGFFTKKGEAGAARLIEGICRDVRSDAITRRMSMSRLVETMERVGTFDEGAQDPQVIERVLKKLNTAFGEAGFIAADSGDYKNHSEFRRTSTLPLWSGLPVRVASLAALAGGINQASAILAEDGIRVSFSELPPWHDDYGVQDEHLSFYTRMPQGHPAEKAWSVGCMVLGNEHSQYLDVIMNLERPAEGMALIVPELSGETHMSLLKRMERHMRDMNIVLAEISMESSELSDELGFECKDEGITPTWDGVPVSAEAGFVRLSGRNHSNSASMEGIVFQEENHSFRR